MDAVRNMRTSPYQMMLGDLNGKTHSLSSNEETEQERTAKAVRLSMFTMH